jgi:ATP-binding cassette subfamily B protein RaxB
MCHFVVLRTARKGKITIHDPAVGVRRVRLGEVDRAFTGIALELWPTEEFRSARESDPVTARELLGTVHGLGDLVGRALVLAAMTEIVALCAPFLLQWIVDHVILAREGRLAAAVAGLLLLGILEAWTTAARGWSTINLGSRLSVAWQSNLFSHLLGLPVTFFEKRSTGEIMSRFDASEVVRRVVTGPFANAAVSGAVAALTLAAMLFYSRSMGGIVVLGAAVYLAARQAALGPLREAAANEAVCTAQMRTHLMETLQGIRPLKLFSQEAHRVSRWLNLLVDTTNARSKGEALTIGVRAAGMGILGVETAAVVWLGARSVMSGALSLGALFAFLAFKEHFNSKMMALINDAYDLRTLKVHLDRISDVVRESPEVGSEASPQSHWPPVSRAQVSLEVSSVWFRYSDTDPWVIRDLSLSVRPGECIAIIGRSGSGKSTLVKLMCGLLAPTRGQVLADGLPVTGDHRSTRRLLGVVLQEDAIFSGTVAENIHFFSEEPDMARVAECVRLAALDAEIEAMPMHYETRVGTAGTALSGGQRQRLLIARALYRSPAVLIFDEATSHLDLVTERMIAASLAGLSVTRIIVAHRPETVAIADRVVAIDGAHLVPVRGEFRETIPEAEHDRRSANSTTE